MMRGASVDSDDEDNEDDDLIDDRVDLLNAVCMAASKFILKELFPLEAVIEDDELTMVEEEGLDSCISLAHVDVFITVVVC